MNMGLDIAHYIPVKGIDLFDGYELIDQNDFDTNPGLISRLKDYIEKQDDDFWLLYYRELGGQRKGMSQEFYNRFKPGYYLDRNSVEEAFKYLKGDHLVSLEQLRANFKSSFIDNFQAGRSIFYVSY
jgi:hypothetical protein